MLRLIFIDPPFAERVCHLSAERTTVGRDASNTLVIADASVSSQHGEILLWGTELIIRDLNSRNGTVVNGVRLRGQQAPATTGAIVEFGTVRTRLELDVSADSDTVTDFTAARAFVRYSDVSGTPSATAKPAEPPPATSVQIPKPGGAVMDPLWLRRILWMALLAAVALALFSWLGAQGF